MSDYPITAYYDRKPGTIEGLFTLQTVENGVPTKLFNRLPARSGQQSYCDTDWVRGQSPIPMGRHFLWLDPVNPGTWPKTPGGIGEFYPISSGLMNRRIIMAEDTGKVRMDIGLHPENAYPGSAGCIVLLHDTPVRKAEVMRLFAFLRTLGKSRETIDLVVL